MTEHQWAVMGRHAGSAMKKMASTNFDVDEVDEEDDVDKVDLD